MASKKSASSTCLVSAPTSASASSNSAARCHRAFFAEVGGLLSHGVDRTDNFRRAATYVDRILKGEKLADPKLKARLADLGGKVLPSSPADFGKLIADETEKWAKVIKFAGIKAE